MFTTDLVNLYNRNIFKTSLYFYIFQDEKCRLMRNLSLSMGITGLFSIENTFMKMSSPELGTFVLVTHYLDCSISLSAAGTFNYRNEDQCLISLF